MLLLSTGLYHQKGVRVHFNCQEAVIAGLDRACADCDDLAEHAYAVRWDCIVKRLSSF
jgi:hypothetical protein